MRIKSSGFGDFTVLAQFSSFSARNLKRCVRIQIHEVIFLEIHVVHPGDTLYSIGQRHGVAPGLIARYNGLREPYRLAVGQALLILHPLLTYRVREGDTLYSVAQKFDSDVLMLLRNNPNLSGSPTIYPGQVLVIRLEAGASRPCWVTGYAYPYVTQSVLHGILPYAGWLIPFTYGITADGGLVPLDDAALLALAREYGVSPLLHLSTLTESGSFSNQRAADVLSNPAATQQLIESAVSQMLTQGYDGIDVDFEFLGEALRERYAAFVAQLRRAVDDAGGILITALAPKTRDDQPGILYQGHDYALLGRASDVLLIMAYEWGYSFGPPMAVAPLNSVRRVVEYAVERIPAGKLLLGFPNYAYDWTLPYRSGQSRAVSIGNEAAVQLAVQTGAEIQFDETAQTPYFHYTAPDGAVHEVWFEDARSCAAKLALVEEFELRGVGVWNFMRPFTVLFSLLDHQFKILTPNAPT